jgi:hypothetical protein
VSTSPCLIVPGPGTGGIGSSPGCRSGASRVGLPEWTRYFTYRGRSVELAIDFVAGLAGTTGRAEMGIASDANSGLGDRCCLCIPSTTGNVAAASAPVRTGARSRGRAVRCPPRRAARSIRSPSHAGIPLPPPVEARDSTRVRAAAAPTSLEALGRRGGAKHRADVTIVHLRARYASRAAAPPCGDQCGHVGTVRRFYP